jgi:hypothetical protein
MHQAVHTILRSPGLILLTIVSLLMIFAIVMSAWNERKRERRFRKQVERARLNNLATHVAAPATLPSPQPSSAAIAVRHATTQSFLPIDTVLTRMLRRPGLLMAGAAFLGLLVTLHFESSQTVRARTFSAPESTTPDASASPRGSTLGLSTNLFLDQKRPADFSSVRPARSSRTNDAYLWQLDAPSDPSAQIDISAPSAPVATMETHTTPAWGKVKLIKSDAPQPPIPLPQEP